MKQLQILPGDGQVPPRRTSLTATLTERPPFSSKCLNSAYYGETSLSFFLQRMSSFLATLQSQPQLQLDIAMSADDTILVSLADGLATDFLQRSQEDHYLELFWQTHQFSYPIIDEADFRKQYQSLWSNLPPDTPRPSSALIDIVLALCIQQGTCFLPKSDDASPPTSTYNTLAGFNYYQRCQALLDETNDTPSILTVQCYVFSIVYLCEAGLSNKAQVMTGKAVMMAIIMGLNYEPPSDHPEPQKELARRIWWSLYILDTQLGIEVGRTFITAASQIGCRLPANSPELARSLGPRNMFFDSDITWLGFQNQTLHLLDTVRSISTAFHAKSESIMRVHNTVDFYSNGHIQEECARFLTDLMKDLNSWAKQLPAGYKMPRRGGEPLSTDRTPLEIDHDVPLSYQRQRVILELQYHLHSLILYRPFIRFTRPQDTSTPVCDSKATSSLNHAIALTNMIHQALSSSDILNGLNQVFHWQKNAMFTMVGFVYTYPISHHAAATRKAIETAISVIQMYSATLPEADRVANIAKSLTKNVESIIKGFHGNSSGPTDSIRIDHGPDTSSAPFLRTGKERDSVDQSLSPLDTNSLLSLALMSEGSLDTNVQPTPRGATDFGDSDAFWADLEPVDGGGDSWPWLDDALTQYADDAFDNDLLLGGALESTTR
jgi:hypothetical protein